MICEPKRNTKIAARLKTLDQLATNEHSMSLFGSSGPAPMSKTTTKKVWGIIVYQIEGCGKTPTE